MGIGEVILAVGSEGGVERSDGAEGCLLESKETRSVAVELDEGNPT